MTPGDIKLAIHRIEEAISTSADGTIKTFNMDVRLAELFVDFLKNLDPDMPRIWRQALPQPLLPMLGPIAGEEMINTKLRRLDDLADKLGTATLLLSSVITQLGAGQKRPS